MRKKKAKPYASGFAFWLDLVEQFGKRDAKAVANNYLECPVADCDEGEIKFREELQDAMTA